jgi:hypothetical protein
MGVKTSTAAAFSHAHTGSGERVVELALRARADVASEGRTCGEKERGSEEESGFQGS